MKGVLSAVRSPAAHRSHLARPHRFILASSSTSSSSASGRSLNRAALLRSPSVGRAGNSTNTLLTYRLYSTSRAAFATHADGSPHQQPPHGKGKETASNSRKGSDDEAGPDSSSKTPQSKKDGNQGPSKNQSGLTIPGLEDFFGGALGRGAANKTPSSSSSGAPKRLSENEFPFGFSENSSSSKETGGKKMDKDGNSNKDPFSPFGNGGPAPSPGTGTPILLIALGLILYNVLSSNDGSNVELTWQEFRTAFLDKGLVDKLVVINRSKVRVHLHSNATGVLYPKSPAAEGKSTYYFSIGSVEAFERKLEDAQNELGIPSSERVPVAYKDETSIANTLASFAPSILFFALLYYVSRRASGGVSGGMGGGPGGIFGVGKSKAKMFNVSAAAIVSGL